MTCLPIFMLINTATQLSASKHQNKVLGRSHVYLKTPLLAHFLPLQTYNICNELFNFLKIPSQGISDYSPDEICSMSSIINLK